MNTNSEQSRSIAAIPAVAPLEDGATYLVRFANSDDPRDAAELLPLIYAYGYWIGPNDLAAYADGPLTVAEAGYEVVGLLAG